MVRSKELVTGGGGGLSIGVSTVDMAVVVAVTPFGWRGCKSRRRFESVSAVVKRFLNLALNTTLSPIDTRCALPLLHGEPPAPVPCGRVVVVAVGRMPLGRVDDGGGMPVVLEGRR